MELISLNVGLPRVVIWKGREVTTGIYKEPVAGAVGLRKLNLDGDRQADLSVHGGPQKAVYAYPSEHYAYWRSELDRPELTWGMFGENFTTDGLLEKHTNIGDTFRIGSALVMVTQPRMPCYKLGIKFERDDILKRFLSSLRSGFYFSVLEEGEVTAGDEIKLVAREPNNITVEDITKLYSTERDNEALKRRAIEVEALPLSWRNFFLKQRCNR
ncbi:MAG TPA: MOSC domain-containing protein [Blastocatellia bacterium]|nr:MOSC domain-containing protein [Blastocatellia bacterium]